MAQHETRAAGLGVWAPRAAPNFDLRLLGHLGLPGTAARPHVGFMGCHGALNGLRVAGGYADSAWLSLGPPLGLWPFVNWLPRRVGRQPVARIVPNAKVGAM